MAVLKREQWERFRREYPQMASLGLSDVAIAKEIGVTRQTVSKWRDLVSSGIEHEGAARPKVNRSALRGAADTLAFETAQNVPSSASRPGMPEIVRSNEAEWMRRLLAKLLFENERLKAIVAGEIVEVSESET